MELVGVGDGESGQHEEENDVAQNEVGSEITQLGNLAKELTARLGQRMPPHVVPFTGPPGDVGFIMLELTGQSQGNDQLVNEALDRHDRNQA